MGDFWKKLKEFLNNNKYGCDEKFEYEGSIFTYNFASQLWDIIVEKEAYSSWLNDEVETFRDYSRLLKKENNELREELEESENNTIVFNDTGTGYLN